MAPISTEISGFIGIIRLNRPEKFNAFNREMALALQEALDMFATDKNVRVVYLTGIGKAFCAGQDLSELTGENPPGFEVILAEHYNPIIKKIRTLDKPVVCAVNGVAAGAGANIALCCDVVVATASASFIQAFSKIGLIPDSGGTFTLPRLIGFQKASALMMLGDKVTASEAERMGMIYKEFPDDSFEKESLEIAHTLSRLPCLGLAYTKEALNASVNNTLDQQLQKEDELQFKAANTHDYREGIAAFIEKRTPNFKGE
jgi:2-(1,2-epoxy-1,2-dihydrophenyl)acetyl-CoA isomerase